MTSPQTPAQPEAISEAAANAFASAKQPMADADRGLALHTAELGRKLAEIVVRDRGDQLRGGIAEIAKQILDATQNPDSFSARPADEATYLSEHGFDITPATGKRNLLAPPLDIGGEPGSAVCRVTLPLQYQGPPRRVHGGIVGVLLDQVLGRAVRTAINPLSAYTRYLNVTYELATPLYEEIEIRARVVSREGRKIFAEGEILAPGGIVCARAEGLWVIPREGLTAEPAE